MNDFIMKLVLAAFVAMIGIVQGQLIDPGLTVNSTIEISGVNSTIGDDLVQADIQGATLSIRCLLLVRLKGRITTPSGTKQQTAFGGYLGNGADVSVNFQQFAIPQGSVIDPFLDVSASRDIDLHVCFNVNYTSPCVAKYSCSGSIFEYTFSFLGLTC